MRRLRAFPIDPAATGFAGARSVIMVCSQITTKKTGQTTADTRFYLSSLAPAELHPAQWHKLIRGHWAGVEIRNHWRRDALLGEDRSRTRNRNALANLALLRNTLLAVIASHSPNLPLPRLLEHLHSRPAACLAILRQS